MAQVKPKKIVTALSLIFTLTATSIIISKKGFAHEINDSNYNTTAHIGLRAGDSIIESYADFIVPIWKNKNNHLFFNPRFSLTDEGSNQFNIGLGFRHLFDNRGILGGNIFYDSRESNIGFRYEQLGAGLEWLGNYFDVRANVYDAQDQLELANSFQTTETQTRQQSNTSQSTSTSTNRFGISTPFATGNNVNQTVQTDITTETVTTQRITTRTVKTDRTFEQFEGALDGWDAEIGFKLPISTGPEIRLFGGYYSYDNPFNSNDISGAKARLQVRSGNYLTFDVEYYEDSFDPSERSSDYFLGARLEVPLTGKTTWKNVLANIFGNSNRSLEDRLHHEIIIRDVRIHTDISDPIENESLRVNTVSQNTQTRTSTEIEIISSTENELIATNVYFVDPENTGTASGTIENPFQSVAAAVAAAPDNATVFVCEAGGGVCDFNGGGGTHTETVAVTLKAGQTLTSIIPGVGGGPSLSTQQRPIITNPNQANGTGVINTAAAGGNTINRLAIVVTATGANRHGILNNQTSAPVTITDNVITSGTGNNSNTILNSQTTATITVTNNTLISNGQNGDGIENNATQGSVIIDNNTFTGSAQNSRGVFNINTTGPITISNNTLNTTGINAEGIQNINVQDTVTITNNTITTTGSNGHAILTNSSSSGDIIATGNTITTADGDGINNNGNSGVVILENNTIMTSGTNNEGIINNAISNDVTIINNTVTTNGNNSEGIQTSNTGNISLTGNTITTNGTGAEGILNSATTPSTGTTTVSNNTVTTTNSTADGIVNIGRTDTTVNANTVTTTGNNSEGIRNNLSTGELTISDNTVSTAGTGAEGILNTNIAAATATIENNTVNTSGNNSEGIETNPGAANSPVISITGNSVITQGTAAHALNTINIGNTAGINSNDLNTNQTSAFGSRNRTLTGGIISIDNNTICVPAGGQATDNAGTGTINVGTNTLLNQTPCP